MSPALGPATVVRRVPVVDELDHEGRRLVLLPGRAVLADGLGPSLLDLAVESIALGELTRLLVTLHGAPPDSDAAELVAGATAALLEEGLLEEVSPTPRPRGAPDPPDGAGPR